MRFVRELCILKEFVVLHPRYGRKSASFQI